jgi:hypothetical protein
LIQELLTSRSHSLLSVPLRWRRARADSL